MSWGDTKNVLLVDIGGVSVVSTEGWELLKEWSDTRIPVEEDENVLTVAIVEVISVECEVYSVKTKKYVKIKRKTETKTHMMLQIHKY